MFNEFGPLIKADVWTITLASGLVLRWSGSDVPLQLGTRFFELGPGLKRSRIKWRVGISSDMLTVQVTDIANTVLGSQPLAAFIRARGFNGARVQLERVFWRPSDAGPVGALLWFLGDVEDADGDRHEATLQVASFTKRLEVATPRDVYQTQCANNVFDEYCGLSAAAYTVAGTVTQASTGYRTTFGHALVQPAGWGSLGLITMTSGANQGLSRTCKEHTPSHLVALQFWPFPVAVGDTFTLRAGCDRLKATCFSAKFNNGARFRAQPFIPVPETVL